MGLNLIDYELFNQDKNKEIKWKPLGRAKYSKIPSDQVCLMIRTPIQLKSTTRSDRIAIYIGYDVSSLLKFNKGDRVEVMMHPDNRYVLKIAKTQNDQGYKLCASQGNSVLNFQFNKPPFLHLKSTPTTIADFDLFMDKSIVIDLSKFRIN